MVNAGHENPMVIRKNGRGAMIGMTGGPPFCVVEWNYPVETFKAEPGDTLVVITDGATEATSPKDELFGTERVIGTLESDAEATAQGKASNLATEVRRFEDTRDPTDDLTIFTLRYRGH